MQQLIVTATLEGISPLTWGGHVTEPKKNGEPHDAYEERTWQKRAHIDANGHAYLISLAIKNCLDTVAQHLSESVPGAGSSKYTKHFARGVQSFQPLIITDLKNKPLTLKDLSKYTMFVPAEGKRGGGTRVVRNYPTAMEWRTKIELLVMDRKINADLVKRYLGEAGMFIGLGSFRAENRGIHGRFKVIEFASVMHED